jgi:uncharacterized membrane protein
MSDAHYHLIVNHFPIIGTILGMGILLAGIILKNNTVKNVSYVLFIVTAIFTAFSMGTGEGAEEAVEEMPNIGKHIIHEHEELAEKLAILLYVLGIISLLGLYTNSKNHSKAKLISFLAFTISILGVFVAQKVGTSGGEIRHTEIRTGTMALQNGNSEQEEEESE